MFNILMFNTDVQSILLSGEHTIIYQAFIFATKLIIGCIEPMFNIYFTSYPFAAFPRRDAGQRGDLL